ncbi:hypothetical protein DFA_03947 [Cavenderia fasciculata]|uniref:Transmembrane protein n=1 Tax=Cavenderia fasciculata TaxID=261658 RepID=F4Q0V2_CACFS|nr:uncharacterized protein DFA_03947 [Cavenderia fasciculata]EGG18453.1 hypothetical protein DFA_03947 [Cavenderia fasciculata]|eukprot:XP_004366357.1 hypothetical protein DFA_03947 [Cavenderia fasciculata]
MSLSYLCLHSQRKNYLFPLSFLLLFDNEIYINLLIYRSIRTHLSLIWPQQQQQQQQQQQHITPTTTKDNYNNNSESTSNSNSNNSSGDDKTILYYNVDPSRCTQSHPCNLVGDTDHWTGGQSPNCSSTTQTAVVYIISNGTDVPEETSAPSLYWPLARSTTSTTSYVLWNTTCSIIKLVCNGSDMQMTVSLDADQPIFDLEVIGESMVNVTRDLNVGRLQVNDTAQITVCNATTLQVGAAMTIEVGATVTLDNSSVLTTLDDAVIRGKVYGGSYVARFEIQGATGIDTDSTIHLVNVSSIVFNTIGVTINHVQVSTPRLLTTTITLMNTSIGYLSQDTYQRRSSVVIQGFFENHINRTGTLQSTVLNLTATTLPVVFTVDDYLSIASGSIISNTQYATDSILNLSPLSRVYSPAIMFSGRDTAININNASITTPNLQVHFGSITVTGESSQLICKISMLNTSTITFNSDNAVLTGRLEVDSGSNTSIQADTVIRGDFVLVTGQTYIKPSAHLNISGNFIMGLENYDITDFGTTLYFNISDTSLQPIMMVDGNVDIKGGAISVSLMDSIPSSSNFTKLLIQTTANRVFWLNDSVSSNSGGPYIDLFYSEFRLQHHSDNSTSLYIVYTRRPGAPGREPSRALAAWAIGLIIVSVITLVIVIGVFIYLRRRGPRSGYGQIN